MRVFGHMATVVLLLAAFLFLPAWLAGAWPLTIPREDEAARPADVRRDLSSGHFVILVNPCWHEDEQARAALLDYLAGGEAAPVSERVVCSCCEGDEAGIRKAESLALGLPEGQMEVRVKDGMTTLSKAAYGRFDVIVMSGEEAERHELARILDNVDTEVVKL